MNEDDVNLSEMYGQQPQQRPQQQPIQTPWSYQDNLQLQQNMQGLASVDSEIAKGEITAEEGQIYKQQIGQRLAPLQVKQKQFQAQQQQEQQTQLMHQMALQESIQQQHAQVQAQAFPQTVASFTDPLTGRTAHFYQGKRGDWKPIEHGDFAETATESDAPAAHPGTPMSLPGAGVEPPEIDKPLYEEDIPALREEQRQREEAARANRAAGPSESERWRNLPENPTDAQVKRWAAGQTNSPLSLEDYAQAMRDDSAKASGGAPSAPTALNEHELGVLRQRAEATVQKIQSPPGGIKTPQQAAFVRRQIVARQKAVDNMVQHWSQAELRKRQKEHEEKWRTGENERRETAREEYAQRREQEKKDRQQSEKERIAAFRHHYDAAGKEKDAAGKPVHGSHEARVEEARKRVQAEQDFIKPKEEAKPATKAPEDHAKEAEALQAEMERRKEEAMDAAEKRLKQRQQEADAAEEKKRKEAMARYEHG